MNQWMTVLQIVMPIFVAVGLGMLAKRKELISSEQMQGLQQFVMKFGLPTAATIISAFLVKKAKSFVLL